MKICLTANLENQIITDELKKFAQKIEAIGYQVALINPEHTKDIQELYTLLENSDILLVYFCQPYAGAINAFEIGYFTALKIRKKNQKILLGVKNCFADPLATPFLKEIKDNFNYFAKNEKMIIEYLKVLILNKKRLTL
jgi:hypothetical protein